MIAKGKLRRPLRAVVSSPFSGRPVARSCPLVGRVWWWRRGWIVVRGSGDRYLGRDSSEELLERLRRDLDEVKCSSPRVLGAVLLSLTRKELRIVLI